MTANKWPVVLLFAVVADAMSATASLSLPGIKIRNQHSVQYRCKDDVGVRVHYINTTSGSFAYLPVDGRNYLFANVDAASGARYVTGRMVWWSKGREASLSEAGNGHGGALRACTEVKTHK